MTIRRSVVRGTGSYLPSRVLTNDELSTLVDTSDEWIVQRSGIRERHIAAEGEYTSDLATNAARSALDNAGIDAAEIDIIMGTLSKSLASCGGYIAGSGELVEYLKYTNPAFVYSVGLTPPDTAAALAALAILKREPERTVCLKRNARVFLEAARGRGLDTGRSSGSSVVPIITGDSLLAIRLSEVLFEHHINAQPIFYPAVENDAARLRFFITCDHTEQELVDVAGAVADHLATIRQQPGLTSHVFGR